jgi:hypothetical protein
LTEYYLPIGKLGIGAYGVVVEVRDRESGTHLAMKIFPMAEANISDVVQEALIHEAMQGVPKVPEFFGFFQFSDYYALATQVLGASMKT